MSHRNDLSERLLERWFSTMDDLTPLDRTTEPFRSCYARWYGKDPAVDQALRDEFEAALVAVTAPGIDWRAELEGWRAHPRGLLALVILLDQLPRNLYRGTAQMYAHDPLALHVTTLAIEAYPSTAMPLLQRMFLYVPLMHVEHATIQDGMVQHFVSLVGEAERRVPASAPFFQHALGYAERHRDVIRRFGRFPHRNAILGRASSEEEITFLAGPDSSF